uniref:NADP-dependent oxidoreductase domain-containing protein 1 isoform X1 n=1 Tax=Pristiophorus japonicus TaxID=55135 RepID=UPI00398EA5B6
MASVDYSGLTEHLPSLSFEAPLTEEEKVFSKKLRLRCWAQTLCGCAHAAFYCKLLTAIRCRVLDESCFHHSWMSKFLILRIDSGSLRIGVLGCGVLGKQLVLALLQLSDLTPANITVSTRRPENLSELTKLGVKCIYDNKRMAASVDVMFLCCLPSHLITVSSQIRGCMSESCIVYSFVTAVPVLRLKHLLAHSTIVRPQYSHCGDPWVKLWESHKNALGALLDQEVIEVSSPFKESGNVCVNHKWFEEVIYSILNVCYFLKVPHKSTVNLLNEVLFSPTEGVEALGEPTLFACESFVNATCAQSLSYKSPFPWFDLSTVSQNDTPLTRFLWLHPRLQHHLSFIYRVSLLKKRDWFDTEDYCDR